MFRLFLLLNFLALTWLACAQQPSYFRFAEKEFEGVDIYDVIQDKEFNYYFATDHGIFKHDGYSFQKIECNEMSGGSVFHFVMNEFGTIYCHNLNKQVFQIKKNSCTLVYTIPDVGNDVDIIVTHDNHLLISTSRNVYVLDQKNNLIQSTDYGTTRYFVSPINLKNKRTILHQSGSNNFLVYANKKLKIVEAKGGQAAVFDQEVLHFYHVNKKSFAINAIDKKVYQIDEETLALDYISDIKWNSSVEKVRFYGVDDHLWMASNVSGVIKVPNKLESIHIEDKLFTDFFISDIYKDKEGNILLSTFDEGVIVVPDLTVNDVETLFNPYFITKLESTKNDLFLGTRDGKILRLNEKLNEISTSGSKGVEQISVWPGKDYVLSDNGGFSFLNLKTGVESFFVNASLKDVAFVDDEHFIAAMNVGLYEFEYDHKLKKLTQVASHINGRMYNVEHEKESNYLYVSSFDGLKFLDPKRKIHSVTLNNEVIHAISLSSTGDKTFISTRKKGVLVLKKGKVIDRFYPKHKNESLVVTKLLIHNSTIYANTQVGFVIMDLNGKILHYLNKSSGLSTNKIIDFTLQGDNLWIAHSRGVQRFRISDITTSVLAPKLILKYVLVNGKKTNTKGKRNQFASDQSKFKFVIQVPTLKHRENIRYHYKLEGNNEQWIVNEYDDNEVIYNALGAGNYRFVVRAENNGVFSNPIYYTFSISEPYYQRIWFLALIGIFFIFIVSLIYWRQLKIQRKKALQINELNASRLTAIQSQMNPHFIFNSLNSIQDLVLKGDIDNSYTFITKFSNLVRRTLNYSDKDFIDFEQEIKLIELYLSLEKLRFKEDLIYTIDTSDIEDIMIPPTLIQPFIENALVHGLMHKEGLKQLDIKFSLKDVLICEISDNGVGRDKALEIKKRKRANHESFAVNAIKRRFNILKVHFKGELGFVIDDIVKNDKIEGTKVTLRIPIKNKF